MRFHCAFLRLHIKTYLFMLDLIYEIDVRFDDGSFKKRVVFAQPGMRYSLSKALVHSLLDDPTFNELIEKSDKCRIQLSLFQYFHKSA